MTTTTQTNADGDTATFNVDQDPLPNLQPLIKGGQSRSDESISADAVVVGWCGLICIVTGLVCLMLVMVSR